MSGESVTTSRRSVKIPVKNGYLCPGVNAQGYQGEAALGQEFRARYGWSWLRGQKHHFMKHLKALGNFCFHPKRYGKPMKS